MNEVINRYLFQFFRDGIEVVATPFKAKRNALALYDRYYNLYINITCKEHVILKITDYETGGVIEEYDSQQADC